MTFVLYISENNPEDLTGVVGGAITSTPLSGYVSELFYHVSAPPSGLDDPSYQYRKIFVKNEFGSHTSEVRLWLDAVEHSGQVHVTTGTSSDTSYVDTEPTVDDWHYPSNYSNGIALGDLAMGSSQSVWIRQTLSGITTPDPYATFRIVVGGLVE